MGIRRLGNQNNSKKELNDIVDSLFDLTKDLIRLAILDDDNSDSCFIETYHIFDDDIIMKGTDKFNKALSQLDRFFGNDVDIVTRQLKESCVLLTGNAGTGKGLLSQNIGASIVECNDKYQGFVNLELPCSGVVDPSTISWGTSTRGINLGGFYTACKFAEKHSDIAVVVILDELIGSDYRAILGNLLGLLSSKREHSETCVYGNTIRYEDNLYVIATGYTGTVYNSYNHLDECYRDLFFEYKLSGLFESEDNVEKFISHTNMSKDFADAIRLLYNSVVCLDIADRKVSLRKLNRFILGSESVEDFKYNLLTLFSDSQQKKLKDYMLL